MTPTDIRIQLKKAYRSTAWSAKVDRMSDQQAVAIFKRLQSQKKV